MRWIPLRGRCFEGLRMDPLVRGPLRILRARRAAGVQCIPVSAARGMEVVPENDGPPLWLHFERGVAACHIRLAASGAGP